MFNPLLFNSLGEEQRDKPFFFYFKEERRLRKLKSSYIIFFDVSPCLWQVEERKAQVLK